MVVSVDIVLLAGCWAMALTASTLLTACGPLAAKYAGAPTSIAPFTVGAFLFGAAIVSGPSDKMFRRWGRKGGFALGVAVGGMGSAMGAVVLELKWHWGFLLMSAFLVGVSQGVEQFLRFAATELCSTVEERSQAVTLVLAGGILAAFAGPQAAVHTQRLEPVLGAKYSGCFAVIFGANVLNLILVLLVRFADVTRPKRETTETAAALAAPLLDEADRSPTRSIREILAQPRCACAVLVAALAHTSMVMLMSPLTLAMDSVGFSYQLTSLTLELHFFSMYVPGLLGTGALIRRLGPYAASVIGLFVYGASATTLVIGQHLWQFILGMSLCGVAWNFTFSAATVLLTTCYTADEALRVQAANDLIIFGLAGVGSFASGYLYAWLAWRPLVYVVSGLMAAFAAVLGLSLRFERRQQKFNTLLDDSNHDGPRHSSQSEVVPIRSNASNADLHADDEII